MEMHEIEQRSVIGKGEHLIQSGHPAPHAIEVCVWICIMNYEHAYP